MALPSSGLMTLTMAATEYSIAAPHMLTKLYGKPGLPAAGLIRLSDLYAKANIFTLTITQSVASPDIHQLALSAGWNGAGPLAVMFNCPYVNTLRFDGNKAFPGGLTITIASICLVGGVINSGTAIYTRVPLTIYNYGTVAGGGGQGGRGQQLWVKYRVTDGTTTGHSGTMGNGQGFANAAATTPTAASPGGAGTLNRYNGELVGGHIAPWAEGGGGGRGGDWGDSGGAGFGGSIGGNYVANGVDWYSDGGSLAGLYIDGASLVTWGATGTRLGRSA